MLLAHKIEIRPTKEQDVKLTQWVGTYRHVYNQLLGMFSDKSNDLKWSKSVPE